MNDAGNDAGNDAEGVTFDGRGLSLYYAARFPGPRGY
jgi:hypothetical protein